MTRATGRRLLRAGAGIAAVSGVVALLHQTARAEGAAETSVAAQAAVGPMPLLAALAVGIALAVGAVVAFLQMTAKGRPDQTAPAVWRTADQPAPDTEPAEELRPAEYTIPLQAVRPPEPAALQDAEQGEPRLCGVEGQFAGACFRLTGRGLSIGRDPAQCSVVFPLAAGEVSRRHCTLRFEPGRRLFVLEDHGSSNGTFLPGGQRLEPGKRYELRAGERFALSGSIHWFEVRE